MTLEDNAREIKALKNFQSKQAGSLSLKIIEKTKPSAIGDTIFNFDFSAGQIPFVNAFFYDDLGFAYKAFAQVQSPTRITFNLGFASGDITGVFQCSQEGVVT